jgi:signal transduction histidine kinase
MPYVPNDCRSSFSGRRENRPVTSPSVQNSIAGLRDEKSRQHDSRNTAAMGVAMAKFAHEFANELYVVSGAIQFLENDIEQPNQARNTLQYVKSGIERLGSLLNELRTLAQAQRLSLQPTQLVSVIKEVLAIEEPRYAVSRVRVETNLPPNLPPIMLDASKFRQALINLCRNAVDAMPHGGSLTLRGYLSHSNVHLEIIDTGEGIPAGLDVFALFTTTKPTGMGVGLPIVREIISSHGGTVCYASKPGTGTTFRLTLPVSE